MDYAKKILEERLKEILSHRESMRKAARRKDKGLNDFFDKWAKESTLHIKDLRKAIKKLNE